MLVWKIFGEIFFLWLFVFLIFLLRVFRFGRVIVSMGFLLDNNMCCFWLFFFVFEFGGDGGWFLGNELGSCGVWWEGVVNGSWCFWRWVFECCIFFFWFFGGNLVSM